MEKEFVSYEQAVALKELGFSEPCYKYIYTGDTSNNIDHYLEVEPSKAKNYNENDLCISQPTLSQVFRWFRDKYDMPVPYIQKLKKTDEVFYVAQIIDIMDSLNTKTYEEAEDACIDKLIELAKQQSK